MRAHRRRANRARRPSRRPPLPAKPSAPPSRRCTRRARRRRPSRARRPSCRRWRCLRRRRRSHASRRPSRGHRPSRRRPRRVRRRRPSCLRRRQSHRPEGEPNSGTVTSAALDPETGGGQQRLALKLASSHRPEGEPNSGTVTSAALDLETGGGQQSLALKLASSHRPEGEPNSGTITSATPDLEAGGRPAESCAQTGLILIAPTRGRTQFWHRHERRARSGDGGGQQSLALKLASSHRPEGEPNSGTITSAAPDLEAGGRPAESCAQTGLIAPTRGRTQFWHRHERRARSGDGGRPAEYRAQTGRRGRSRTGRAADARLKSSASAPGRCAIVVRSRSSLSGWMKEKGQRCVGRSLSAFKLRTHEVQL